MLYFFCLLVHIKGFCLFVCLFPHYKLWLETFTYSTCCMYQETGLCCSGKDSLIMSKGCCDSDEHWGLNSISNNFSGAVASPKSKLLYTVERQRVLFQRSWLNSYWGKLGFRGRIGKTCTLSWPSSVERYRRTGV